MKVDAASGRSGSRPATISRILDLRRGDRRPYFVLGFAVGRRGWECNTSKGCPAPLLEMD